LPQWEIAMLRHVLATALVLAPLAAPAFADEPFRLFDCGLGDGYSDAISLYAQQHDDGAWSDLQLLVEKDGIIRIMVQDAPGSAKSRFLFSNSDGPDGYYAQVRVSDGPRDYLLHMLDIPPDPASEGDMGGRWVGLRVTEPSGVSYDLPCGETDEYIGYMSEAMTCDMTNRYGAAGCDFDARPTRAADDKLPEGLAP
jgi:hypothetical protein